MHVRNFAMPIRASLLLLSLCVAGEAHAQAVFYHSPGNDGSFPASTPVLGSPGPTLLHLYVDLAGSTVTSAGTACEDGDGDEICGWHVIAEARPGAELLLFNAAQNVQHSLDSTRLIVTGVDAISPGVAPVWIGDLTVQSSDPATGGQIDASGLHVVRADLSVQHVAVATIAVIPAPEPGLEVGLIAGIGLVLLMPRGSTARCRRRS